MYKTFEISFTLEEEGRNAYLPQSSRKARNDY